MAESKPADINKVWAETGGIIKPLDSKISLGWIAEIPTFQNINWLQNLFSKFIKHINEQGVAVHDLITDYPIGGLAKGSDGIVYRSRVTPNAGNDPISSPSEWYVDGANPEFYLDSGAADAYVLTGASGTETSNAYLDGVRVTFRPDNTNTGASTINVEGLGVKDIKTAEGADPAASVLIINELTTLVYDLANDWFEILALGGGGQFLGTAAVKAIMFNAQSIDEDITVAADQNAMSAGPITIEATRTVTIATGGRWVIT